MSEDIEHIRGYYSPDDLYARIVAGLDEIGKDLSRLTLDDLQPVDEFHIRGDTATKQLIQLAGFTPDMHILDVGCGVGGSARRLAQYAGCRVTGVDLSDAYIDTARRLTQLLGMQDRVSFEAASALELPFGDGRFDGAWSIQMGMNVEDKATWLKELHRVVRPGGRVVWYEVCAGEQAPVHFPVPWAQNDSHSFLVGPDAFRALIAAAGFDIEVWSDRTELARKAFAHMKEPVGEPELPELGVHLLVGDDILTKAYNLHRNLEQGRVGLIEAMAVKR